jgi:transketolase
MTKISIEKFNFLANKALNIRINSIKATTASKSGHPTSCMSAADMISVLFFHALKMNIKDPKAINNDRFLLSKGHAIPVVYSALRELEIISNEELLSLRKFDSYLEGHPTPRFIYNEAATGSLGQGLGIGVGMALNAKHEKLSYTTYVMMGDGEIAEGSIWEAAELASYYKLDNLIGIVDCNRLGQSGESIHNHDVKKYAEKFKAFDWNYIIIDGHNLEEISSALTVAQQTKGLPTVIVAKTYKGYGLENVENKDGFHGKPFSQEDLPVVVEALKKRFKEASAYIGLYNQDLNFSISIDEKNTLPQNLPISIDITNDKNTALFTNDQKMATRKAYGYALAALGQSNDNIFVLDCDVKNSTFSEIFEKENPNRFIQCFIAEQNMISVAIGLELRGKIPFAATFACFLTRAHDQIRMAGIGRNALRICGSHAGVSIGEDGPSQMGLEDIAMMRSIPGSVVLYPSDGVSAYKLTELMANYNEGISYLRTTRASTPILYEKGEAFKIGGCKVLKQSDRDRICIIGGGITVHEALKAHHLLLAEGINSSVIDLYSVKPLDIFTIKKIATESRNKIIVVEDHYSEGGLGEAITHAVVNINVIVKSLSVRQISRSGRPEDLLKYAEIDAESIIAAAHEML